MHPQTDMNATLSKGQVPIWRSPQDAIIWMFGAAVAVATALRLGGGVGVVRVEALSWSAVVDRADGE